MYTITIINEATGEVVQREFPTFGMADDMWTMAVYGLCGYFGNDPDIMDLDEDLEEEINFCEEDMFL